MASTLGLLRPTACRGAFGKGVLRPSVHRSRRVCCAHQRESALGFSASPSLAAWEGGYYGCGLERLADSGRQPGRCVRQVTRMSNKSGAGPFTPAVVVVRKAMGKKEFNQFRGKAISLHSQVIKEFGKNVGVDNKQVQGLIRLAKQNGEKLGFLS